MKWRGDVVLSEPVDRILISPPVSLSELYRSKRQMAWQE